MLSSRKLVVLLIIALPLLLGLLCCNFPAKRSISTPQIIEIYQSTVDFSEANQLKYQQDFPRAIAAYETVLQTPTLELADSIYLINQTLYCQLLMNQIADVDSKLQWLESKLSQLPLVLQGLQADYYYNQSRYHFLQKEKELALSNAHQALQQYYQYYPKGHLKIGQTLTLLALIHLKDGNLTDSIHHYSLLANDFFLNQSDLKDYNWENEYILGYCSLLDRAHERGEYHCRATLEKIKSLPFENKWLEARIWKLLANMLKKQSSVAIGKNPFLLKNKKIPLHIIADSLFKKAITIAKNNQDRDLIEFYNDWIINVCRYADSTYFFQAMDIFKKESLGQKDWEIYNAYLMGYYNVLRGYYLQHFAADSDTIIKQYQNFEKLSKGDKKIDYRTYASIYYALRVILQQQQQYHQAASYAKKSFILYDCAEEEIDISLISSISKIDSTKRYCLTTSGFYAMDLLEKFQKKGNPKDLALANAYFDFIEKHGFKSLLDKGEDAFLTFQLEAGSQIYIKALEAASEAWKLSGDKFWLDKMFNFMEHLKSYLLFRDMLKKNESTPKYSLTDSIRIVQGRINEMIFKLKQSSLESEDEVYENNLINTLNNLQNRRKNRIASFTSDVKRNLISLNEVQSTLPSSKGIVNYFSGQNQLFGIYVDRDTVIVFQQNDNFSEFRKDIATLRNCLEKEVKLNQVTIQQYLVSARKLYQSLVSPFVHRLKKIEQLVIIPDQLLDPIPFEVLLTKSVEFDDYSFKKLPYLLHEAEIVYSPSWKVYLHNQSKIQSNFINKNIAFWTNPKLNNTNGLALIEHSVQKEFGDNYVLFNYKNGGKHLFSKEHTSFDILHLLLHASSSKVNRFDNQIRFGDQAKDIIYGFELYQEKFQSKLLVLASCESASGVPKIGEGTFSLSRSFINSGIPEVVAAQYLIPQTTTAPLLSYFYEYLGSGKSAASALHLAKIKYLEKIPKERHAYPRFWAGMVLFN